MEHIIAFFRNLFTSGITCEQLGGPWDYQIVSRDNTSTTFTNDMEAAS